MTKIKRIWDPTPRPAPNDFLLDVRQDKEEPLGFHNPLLLEIREHWARAFRPPLSHQIKRYRNRHKRRKQFLLEQKKQREKEKEQRYRALLKFIQFHDQNKKAISGGDSAPLLPDKSQQAAENQESDVGDYYPLPPNQNMAQRPPTPPSEKNRHQ